ncbi:MAG: protein meaA [Magnetovibrio sp.]|nr:protein meaA [Magnetovibrio sp.]
MSRNVTDANNTKVTQAAANKASSKSQGKDRPWLFRTYSGHSSAAASNELYRTNLSRGQSGLSVAFDLPTQTALDADDVLSRGEVGKVGVPISHLGDMKTLFDGIPLDQMNTSMTINASAAWQLALLIATAEAQGVDRAKLAGTTQNDIIKEYLSRGTYIFAPAPSMRLETDVIAFATKEMPKWNPMNVCSYHLQEAGAQPAEELAFALANAITVLDMVKERGEVSPEDFPKVVGRISFFLNAGIRFVTELCKARAFAELWDEITLERYDVQDPKMRRFRYGVQVNSLGLTEAQPENNVYRIMIEMLSVVLSKNARARAVQLPAWNEALGLPRPWDQQWSLRLQQIMAFETDLLEYGDIFDGSSEITAKVEELKQQAREELVRLDEMGGVIKAVEQGYMKQRLVESNAKRLAAIQAGEQIVVGVNKFVEGEASPLVSGVETFLTPDVAAEKSQIENLKAWRAQRDDAAVKAALARLEAAARGSENIMESSIICAKAGVTTGEWGNKLREVFGEYRAPTGIVGAVRAPVADADDVRIKINALSDQLGTRPHLLVAKPGLDGHSNGAEQVALAARDAGFEVIYEGIRQTPAEIVSAAVQEGVHAVGLSVLSGSHLTLVADVMAGLKERGANDIPVIVGGIIPERDMQALNDMGVARVFTPKDFEFGVMMSQVADVMAANVDV